MGRFHKQHLQCTRNEHGVDLGVRINLCGVLDGDWW